jgi:hypothetical protein
MEKSNKLLVINIQLGRLLRNGINSVDVTSTAKNHSNETSWEMHMYS